MWVFKPCSGACGVRRWLRDMPDELLIAHGTALARRWQCRSQRIWGLLKGLKFKISARGVPVENRPYLPVSARSSEPRQLFAG